MKASRRAAASLRVRGVLPPNNEVNLLPLVNDVRRGCSCFSVRASSEGVEVEDVAANGLMLRAGMAACADFYPWSSTLVSGGGCVRNAGGEGRKGESLRPRPCPRRSISTLRGY